MDFFITNAVEQRPVFERINSRWEVGFLLNPYGGQFTQISFVNGIHTPSGGTHVDHAVGGLVNFVLEKMKKITKNNPLKPNDVKRKVTAFVRATVENPTFESQSKEKLTKKAGGFGSRYVFCLQQNPLKLTRSIAVHGPMPHLNVL